MEYGCHSASYGTMPLLSGKGMCSAPRMVPLHISFNAKYESMRLGLHSGLGSLHSLQVRLIKVHDFVVVERGYQLS